MTRGFVTIATGKEQYYKIAANLVLSYRYFSENPMPFAIIAEEENEYTALFDDVVITTEAMHSFLDKFLLLKLCPYDETIFIDADSLAYGDLNEYWEFFADATDFSATGATVPLHQNHNIWYNVEDIGAYGEKIQYKVRVHSGVCFIRKSDALEKMYEDCLDLHAHYDSLHFFECPQSVDECILGVAMPMNQMKALPEKAHMLAAYPCLTEVHADILHGELSYATPWAGHTPKGILMHWGTKQTYQPLYRFNVECLHYLVDNIDGKMTAADRMKYEYRLRYWVIAIPYFMHTLVEKTISLFKKGIRGILKAGRIK